MAKQTKQVLVGKSQYQALFKDVSAIYDGAMKETALAVEQIFKKAYWQIGRRIVKEEQKGDPHAPYGDHLLEKLAEELTTSNRKGFSVTNLRNMRSVYRTFSIHQLADELTWTHFVELSSIKDKKIRRAYLNRSLKENWNVPRLREVLHEEKVVIESAGALALPAPSASPGREIQIIRLPVTRGVPYLYRVAALENFNKKGFFQVDCGFFIYRELSLNGQAMPEAGDIIASLARGDDYGFKKITEKVARSALFTYKAYVERIIDADTIVVHVDCGFGIISKQKLRLRKINAPELKTPAGKKARDFVVARLKDCPWVVIKTYSTDIFDRFLADVFYLSGEPDVRKVAQEGKYLNQELLDEGLAEAWQTPDPESLAFLN